LFTPFLREKAVIVDVDMIDAIVYFSASGLNIYDDSGRRPLAD
jgi:hypothetical protein